MLLLAAGSLLGILCLAFSAETEPIVRTRPRVPGGFLAVLTVRTFQLRFLPLSVGFTANHWGVALPESRVALIPDD